MHTFQQFKLNAFFKVYFYSNIYEIKNLKLKLKVNLYFIFFMNKKFKPSVQIIQIKVH